MRLFTQIIAVALAAMLMSGCGSEEREQREDRETVFDPLTETLDQAEAVEDIAIEHKDRIDRALSDAEGEDDEPEGM